jgi:hypothetical protein
VGLVTKTSAAIIFTAGPFRVADRGLAGPGCDVHHRRVKTILGWMTIIGNRLQYYFVETCSEGTR